MTRRSREEGVAEAESAAVEAPEAAEVVELDPLRPVRVKNHGTIDWLGSDFKRVGPGFIAAGAEGVVTAKKAQQLVEDFGAAGENTGVAIEGSAGIRGPFEILGDA